MKKRFLSFSLAVLMLLCTVFGTLPEIKATAAGGVVSIAAEVNGADFSGNLIVGDVVTVKIMLPQITNTRKLQVDLKYDGSVLEYNGDVDATSVLSSLTIGAAKPVENNIIRLVATGMSDVSFPAGTVALTASFTVKTVSESSEVDAFALSNFICGDESVSVDTTPLKATVNTEEIPEVTVIRGDVNGDGVVDDADTIYLLRYTFFPDKYPLNQNGDMNSDGIVDDADAIYLLRYTFFSDKYPLNEKVDNSVTLSSNNLEICVNDSGKVYFYAEVVNGVSFVHLFDDDGKYVIDLLDDGKYSSSGDDLPSDNIFSGVLTLDTTNDAVYRFYAVANDGKKWESNTIEIKIVSGFTDEEIEEMAIVDNAFQNNIFESENYDKMNVEERVVLAETVLNEMVKQELIDKESVVYNEEEITYTFMYDSGALGALMLNDWDENKDGIATDSVQERTEIQYFVENNSQETDTSTVDDPNYIGDAIVLWSFEQAWDQPEFRIPFYEELEEDFDKLGLETTIDWDTTIEDYKGLKGYEVIMFSGHGANTTYSIGGKSRTLSSLLLFERVTSDKDKIYENDLKGFRVGKISVQGGTMYAILPNFFSHYYDSDDLDGSFVFIQDCESHGKNGVQNFDFSNALRAASAEAVVGYHNSVLSVYGRNFMKTYFENLIDGKTAGEAFSEAISVHGSNDGKIAYPLFSGDENAVLLNFGIKNGDFEEASTPVYWNQSGDTRILSKLGSLIPQSNNKMAILTTGIGSAEDEYIAGTEGSVLSQKFRIPENVTTLSFVYDVVSEEPYEYVGSSFNDTFIVKFNVNSDTYIVAFEDINTSAWYPIDNINFDGGDNTTYHTGWITVEFDISEYVGEIVDIQFIVYDVGDSIYDTAALVDNVYLK